MIFPEGTWNLSENEIVRDIAYGVADAAISADAMTVPIAIEQYGKHFVICQGEALEPATLQHADRTMLTIALRDEFASLKWKIWERNGVCQRRDLPCDYWNKFIQDRCAEWRGYAMEGQVVNGYMPKDKWEYWQVQRDLKTDKIPLCSSTIFVTSRKWSDIKRLVCRERRRPAFVLRFKILKIITAFIDTESML